MLGFFPIELYLAPCSHLSRAADGRQRQQDLQGQDTQVPSQPAGGWGILWGMCLCGVFLI